MAEHLIQDTTLTGIADKIRSLLGLTGTMTTDQMQTNLTTEQANIAAALAALAEKGVTVPDGSNSNALAGLIAAIESGGIEFPAVFKVSNYVAGSVTMNSTSQSIDLYGFAGITPRFVIIYTTDMSVDASYYTFRFGVNVNNLADAYQDADSTGIAMNDDEFAGSFSFSIKSGVVRYMGDFAFSDSSDTYKHHFASYKKADNSYSMVRKESHEEDKLVLCTAQHTTSSSGYVRFIRGVTYNYVIYY